MALITKHNRWCRFLKIVVVTTFFGSVIGATGWLHSNTPQPQIMTSLNDINLRMSGMDLTLANGTPDQISDLDCNHPYFSCTTDQSFSSDIPMASGLPVNRGRANGFKRPLKSSALWSIDSFFECSLLFKSLDLYWCPCCS